MKEAGKIFLGAVIIAMVAALIGLGVNLVSPKGIPWIYAPPKDLVLAGIKVPIIDEKQAYGFFKQGDTLFVDAREEEDFGDSHIKGAISLPSPQVEERLPAIEPLLPKESRIVLYCSGPDCNMAQEVALVLAQLGYKRLYIMAAGLPAWKRAGFPVEGE
jgi:rhodanese-related sulfurtransferase